MGIVRNRRKWATLAAAATVLASAVVGSGGVVSPAQGAASCPAGSRAVISGGVLSNPLICEVVILASGTWTPPAGVTSVDVLVVGGGGGGGGGAGNYSTWNGSAYTVTGTQILSGGGGGGGQVVHDQLTVSSSSPVNVTIGAGGLTGTSADANGPIAATDGGDGGTTTFGAVSAQGGKGGKSGANGGTGGAAGGASGAAGGSGLQTLQANPQFTAGGGGGGAGGFGGDAEAVSVNYGTFTPQQDMMAGASGAKYTFINDGSLWSSANFGTGVNATPYGLTYYPLGQGGVGGNSIVGGSSQCNETIVTATSLRRPQPGISASNRGAGACWYKATDSGPFGNAGTVQQLGANANYPQANAGAGGNGLVGDRGNQGSGLGNIGAVLIRFYADGGTVPTPVIPTPPTYTASTPPAAATVATSYGSYTFAASGTAPISFSSSGTLPPGLTLASNGSLSGTPTTAGSYTFTVTAANGTAPDATVTITITVAASGGGGGSEPATEPTPVPTSIVTPTAVPTVTIDPLDPINNPDNGNVPARGVAPGGSLLLVNGAPMPVKVVPNARQDPTGLDVRGDDWSMKLVGRGDTSDPLGLTEKQVLILQSEQLRTRMKKVQPVAQASGTGFKVASEVKFYILPSTYLGSLTTDAAGAFSGTVPVPAGISPGSYTLQMNGYSPSSQVRSLSIGVVVKATSAKVRTGKASLRVLFASMSANLTASGRSHLKALVKKTGANASAIASVGYVQKSGTSANDQSLSTARAKNVASYLRSLGLKGAYTVRGDGVGGPTAADRKVVVAVTYRK